MAGDDQTGRKVALVGGAGVLAWWLLGRGGSGPFGRTAAGDDGGLRRASRHVVWIRATRIELDGVPADLPTVVAKCRESGVAEVHATGDATTRVVRDVLNSLRSAGVTVYASPDVASLAPSVIA